MTHVVYFSHKPPASWPEMSPDIMGIDIGKVVALDLNPRTEAEYDMDKLKYFYLEDGREYTGPKWVSNLGFELSYQKVPLWIPINGDMECDAVKWQISRSAAARAQLMV